MREYHLFCRLYPGQKLARIFPLSYHSQNVLYIYFIGQITQMYFMKPFLYQQMSKGAILKKNEERFVLIKCLLAHFVFHKGQLESFPPYKYYNLIWG